MGGRPGRGVHMGLWWVRLLTGGRDDPLGPVAVVREEVRIGMRMCGSQLV